MKIFLARFRDFVKGIITGFEAITVMNHQPSMFRVHRYSQGQLRSEGKRLLPLRKGVADIVVRTRVSQSVNGRFLDNLAAAQCEIPVRDLLEEVVKAFTKEGRRVRAIAPPGAQVPCVDAPTPLAGLSRGETSLPGVWSLTLPHPRLWQHHPFGIKPRSCSIPRPRLWQHHPFGIKPRSCSRP
jgi:hypothetical protein